MSVTLADPAMDRASGDPRASAIAAAARRLFETIGVWPAIAAGAQPILDMVVTDSKVENAMRPTFLTFDGEIAPGEPFAHMIENGPMIAALLDKARAEGVDLRPVAVTRFRARSGACDCDAVRWRDRCPHDCWSPPTARVR